MPDCAFCRLLAGEGAMDAVMEDELAVAFLDHRPVFQGHTLLVPRAHHATLADLPPALLGPFFRRAQLLARAVEEGLGAEGSFVAMNNRISQSVPHLHVHVLPRRKGDGLKGFFWPRQRYPDAEAARSVRDRLRQAVARLRAAEASA
jgi:histidine triad (HIT) family protein